MAVCGAAHAHDMSGRRSDIAYRRTRLALRVPRLPVIGDDREDVSAMNERSAMEIRVASTDDAGAIAGIYSSYVRNTVISFETAAPDCAEIARRIEHIGVQHPWLTARLGGSVVGYAYASEHRARQAYRWSVDVTIYLHPDAQRRGVGSALYERLLALLREQGYVRAFAGIALPNAASTGLHAAMGFTPIGVYRQVGYKFGAWHDVSWWQLVLREAPERPPEPIRFAQLDRVIVDRILA